MKKAVGMNDLMGRNFKTYELEGQWRDHLGQPERNFKMSVTGDSGNGKTDYCMKLAKAFAPFRRVLIASYEEGISSSLQEAARRNNMAEVSGRVTVISKEPFDDLVERLSKRASAGVVIIDSGDYMNLTKAQFKELIERFPRKSFIVVSWAKNDKPKLQSMRDIEFMCDIKVLVKKYRAYPRSRFGGNKTYIMWENPTNGPQKELFQ